ncbi:olfactory receptor 1030-like [Sceloporus undulatus]|uniref:olfactory receptor 1030-like n=1 Tax=Sceloporus undulatus TaxID=8520 RepID=UPI001C4CB7B6|nr:olfactory receptor 1030-like [Sceloporus undulatus]
MENLTMQTEFILLGLSSDPQVENLLCFVFLLIYATTLFANFAILLLIRNEPSLHTPMFFFLGHLALIDVCYSSVTVPKMLGNFFAKKKSISVDACIVQISSFLHFVCVEGYLLSAMAYDRYVAICHPLHYSTMMKKQRCRQLVCVAWMMGFLNALLNTVPLMDLTFCGSNLIHHYTCTLPAVLSLSCSEHFISHVLMLFTATFFGSTSFLLTLVSYIYIISNILKMQFAKSRRKAFSTCSSHLIVVCMFYLSIFIEHLKPRISSTTDLDRVASIQYLILTPLLNPIIYSLKNNDIKASLWKRSRRFR